MPMKILIAEDESVIGENYKMILESRHHEVIIANNGEDCISLFDKAFHALHPRNSSVEESSPFDLVVLDFRMPKKNGIDVAKHILSTCPQQKMIFATAYTLDVLEGLMKKIQMGIEVLQKPFDLDAFADMVEDFGQRSLVSQNKEA
jgi:CheY-like chemotaxis protein